MHRPPGGPCRWRWSIRWQECRAALCPVIVVEGRRLRAPAHDAALLPEKLLSRPVDNVTAQSGPWCRRGMQCFRAPRSRRPGRQRVLVVGRFDRAVSSDGRQRLLPAQQDLLPGYRRLAVGEGRGAKGPWPGRPPHPAAAVCPRRVRPVAVITFIITVFELGHQFRSRRGNQALSACQY